MEFIALKQEPKLGVKQSQHLLLSMAMQKALHVLQMPTLELSEWLQLEIEQNPVLELDLSHGDPKESLDTFCNEEEDHARSYEGKDPTTRELEKKRKAYQESLLTYPISPYEHLTSQARLTFLDPQEMALAERLIGHLDAKGFLSTPLSELVGEEELVSSERILAILQTFDPAGVCAQNLQESLLIQLKLKEKADGLAFQLIRGHFEDLLANKIPAIAKKLHLSPGVIQQAIDQDISPLNLHPGYAFERTWTSTLIPDIYLEYQEGNWEIQINHHLFPHFRIAPIYEKSLDQLSLSKEEQQFLERHITSGNWLKKIVKRREEILLAITRYLIKRQALFLSGEQRTLVPMKIQEIAEQMGMHESTIARAISHKYLSCPQGIFSLRSFFTQGVICPNGQKVSNHTLCQLLSQIIEQEDKTRPFSDAEIVEHFQQMGIPCARRTIAKYRSKLHIAPAGKRRKWLSHAS